MSNYIQNKKEERKNAIGQIYANLKDFFTRAEINLNQSNVVDFEREFNGIFNWAKSVMMPSKYETDHASNSRRWERIKKEKGVSVLTQPKINPVQPTQTPQLYNYIPIEKSAENRAEMMPDEKDKEITRLKQIIVNQNVIIQNLMQINNLQAN